MAIVSPAVLHADPLPVANVAKDVSDTVQQERPQEQPDTVAAYLQMEKEQRTDLLRDRVKTLYKNLSAGLMPSGIKKPVHLLRQHLFVAATLNRYFSLGSPPDHPYQVMGFAILDNAIGEAEENLAFDDVFQKTISQIVVAHGREGDRTHAE